MKIGEAHTWLTACLEERYGDREASAIADLLLESRLSLGRLDRVLRRQEHLSSDDMDVLRGDMDGLLEGKPVQYVLGEAWFDGLRFLVDGRVLIPRPETEELVHWVRADEPGGSILDVGTGSGCIAVALQLHLPESRVTAVDVSWGALDLAQENAERLGAKVQFRQLDFLNEAVWSAMPAFDVIVSNPPYIPEWERASIEDHVKLREPGLALFVQDEDPLLFYRSLARFAVRHLRPGGALYVETHASFGGQVTRLFEAEGLNNIVLRKDMHGQDRMVKATV